MALLQVSCRNVIIYLVSFIFTCKNVYFIITKMCNFVFKAVLEVLFGCPCALPMKGAYGKSVLVPLFSAYERSL